MGNHAQVTTPTNASSLVNGTLRWFDAAARDLPWRRSDCGPWGVLVSEVMLQQTQVDRVLPVWQAWLARWPTPMDLARTDLGTVLRAWGRLGYPRRAQRLHAAAVIITEQFSGQVPTEEVALRSLPGVGEYTAAAVRAFAFGEPAVVLDTNIRRVIARTLRTQALPDNQVTNAERALAASLVAVAADRGARWSAAVMELGALICTARSPKCPQCPVARSCAWQVQGQPATAPHRRRQPRYAGSDRQVRGLILGRLRQGDLPTAEVDFIWPDAGQRQRALQSLQADGLIVQGSDGYRLP